MTEKTIYLIFVVLLFFSYSFFHMITICQHHYQDRISCSSTEIKYGCQSTSQR